MSMHVGYFCNWAIYARKSFPKDVDVASLSHILYAFADVRAETGEVFLTDKWADEDIHYDGDSWNDPPGGLYGNFKQFALLKRQHRHLKLLLSIGGWTYSPHFAFASDRAKRTKFVQTAVQILEDYGLDGLDVDWEYPANKEQGAQFVDLLRELRAALDAAARKRTEPGTKFWLTIAAPCGPSNIENLDVAGMEPHLDAIMLMAYDYSGSWESTAGHQAKVHGPAPSTEYAVSRYLSAGVPSSKLVQGLPLYGRAFTNTDGPGTPFQGVGEGSWEAGVHDWKVLPHSGESVRVHEDMNVLASWEYDNQTRTMVSFDTTRVLEAKVDWAKSKGLGGAMWWELSADRPGEQSAIRAVARKLGPLDQTPNCISYPDSKFSNMRNGFAT
ncbi:Chitinase 4 [Tilletia horrida]|uniref:chitinase n=1 Tax=Tilletia horrida TaxID=155126 RepID=A0AAN6GUJ8_9BASI|nr:Chitinase 4 [Tilletia horrida]KAK0568968.1 Chitinase 4 [Tilletia horrida]